MASESPVEEFILRGRRVLVKRDDKVRAYMVEFQKNLTVYSTNSQVPR